MCVCACVRVCVCVCVCVFSPKVSHLSTNQHNTSQNYDCLKLWLSQDIIYSHNWEEPFSNTQFQQPPPQTVLLWPQRKSLRLH